MIFYGLAVSMERLAYPSINLRCGRICIRGSLSVEEVAMHRVSYLNMNHTLSTGNNKYSSG